MNKSSKGLITFVLETMNSFLDIILSRLTAMSEAVNYKKDRNLREKVNQPVEPQTQRIKLISNVKDSFISIVIMLKMILFQFTTKSKTKINAKIDLLLAFTNPQNKKIIRENFNQFLKTRRGVTVNFYGKTITGKGITAEAIAKALGQKIIQVTHGELDSTYPGKCLKKYRKNLNK